MHTSSISKNEHSLQAALDYMRRGWPVIPIPTGQKGPKISEWQNLRLTESELPARFSQGENVGVLLGEPSGWLVDIDLDSPEAVITAPYFLPKTEAIFGRPSKLRSHLLYICQGAEMTKFQTKVDGTLVEIRSTGGQTVFPPSIHPSGELIAWEQQGEPAEVGLEELKQAVSRLAAASLLARHWAAKGSRQEATLALAGGLIRAGWTEDEVRHFIEAICTAARDEEPRMRAQAAVTTARKMDKPTTGFKTLSGLIGEDVIKTVREWLQIKALPEPETWEPPVPFAEYDLPPLPVDILPAWLGSYVEAVATEKQVPADLPGMLSLSVIGATVAKKAVILVRQGWIEPLNLWTLTALPPGNRKSGTFEDVTKPLEEFERGERDRLTPAVEQAKNKRKIAESRLNHLQSEAAKKKGQDAAQALAESNNLAAELATMETPTIPELIADDISPEAVVKAMADQGGKIAIMSSEGDIFDILAGRYSNGTPNLGNFLKGHAGDTIRVRRVGRPPEYIQKPALTMGLSPQPEVLRGLMDKPGFRGRGLLGRFLYSLPVSPLGTRKIKPPPASAAIRDKYRGNILRLLKMPQGTNEQGQPSAYVLRLSQAAEAVFNDFETWLEPLLAPFADLGNMADWAGKLAGVVARLTGILHLAANAEQEAPWSISITLDTVKGAVKLAREYLIPHAKAAYATMGADSEIEAAKYAWDVIQDKGQGKLTKQEVWQWTKGRFERVEPLDKALQILVERGYLREHIKQREGAGRKPAPLFTVNPLAASYNSYNSNPETNSRDFRNSRIEDNTSNNIWEVSFDELQL